MSEPSDPPSAAHKMSKRKLNCLSGNDKLQIVRRFEQGVSREQLCREFNVPRSTLCRILHQKEKIESQCNEGHGNAVRARPSKCPELEKCLLEWIRRCEEDKLPVNGPIIKDQALKFAAMLGVTDFRASNGWLEGFKNRFGVGKTQVSNLLKDRDSILKDWRENGMGGSMKKRMRKGSADVDTFVYEWFRNAQAQNIPVSGPLIQEKALEVAKALGNPEFKASNGWLCKFKSRHGINWKMSSGEVPDAAANSGASMDFGEPSEEYAETSAEYAEQSTECNEGSAEFVKAEELPLQPAVDWRSVLKKWCAVYADVDVYNCVEMPLLFGALPNQLMFNSAEKTAKQRLTVLLCANVAGDFEEPVIISNTLPVQMENLRLRDLGFSWKVNQYAWMSPEIMTEWLDSFNLRMMVQKRSVVLIMEDSKCHPHLELSNVKLVFLPPNARQPLEPGVVRNLKQRYRTKLLRRLLSNKQPRVSKLDAAMWIVSAIKDIKPAEVQRCFGEVGLCEAKTDQPIAATREELENLVQIVSGDVSVEDYVTIDNHLPTSYSETDIQSIIETIKSCQDDDETGCRPTPNPKQDVPPPDHQTALESLKQVERLLLHDKNTSLFEQIYRVRSEMEKNYTVNCLLWSKNQPSNVGRFNMTLNDNEWCYELADAT